MDSLRMACIDCGHRFDAGAECLKCKNGPLLDLQNPDVRQSLLQEDDERRSKRRSQAIWASVPIAGLAMGLLQAGFIGVMIGGAVGYGCSLLLAKIFPAKQLFPYLR
jgi:hypothetical protein